MWAAEFPGHAQQQAACSNRKVHTYTQGVQMEATEPSPPDSCCQTAALTNGIRIANSVLFLEGLMHK